MINGEIQPPLFKVENEKIGIRHLYSSVIASFWRKHPEYYGSVKNLFGEEKPNDGFFVLKKYVYNHPQDLKEYLLKAFPSELIIKFKINDFGWEKWLFDEPDNAYPNLDAVYRKYCEELDFLYKEKYEAEKHDRFNSAYIRRINTTTKENLISFLSKKNILPKYGFPVDTVELQVSSDKYKSALPIELSRDLAMAISEYAPGCEVVASGNLIKSRYIRTMPDRAWRMYDYVMCNKCNTLNISLHSDKLDFQELHHCDHCNEEFSTTERKTFLIPEFGFIAESKTKKPSLIKPDKTYRTEATVVSDGENKFHGNYSIGTLQVEATAMEDGEIAILNKSDFFVCRQCGYSLSDIEAKSYKNSISRKHKNARGFNCKNEYMQKYSLGYRFKTDALRISLSGYYNYEEALSILHAIILSVCSIMNLDNTEISGCIQYVQKNYQPSYDFIIYDTTPGGAGHVRRISTRDIMMKILVGAYNKAKLCDCGGEDADTSCYKCLRTYQNQQHHDEIKRCYVINSLSGVNIHTEMNSGDVEMTAIEKKHIHNHRRLILKTDIADTSVSNSSYEEIIDNITENKALSDRILNVMISNKLSKPDYSWLDFKVNEGDSYYVDLIWIDKKVMLFSADNPDGYHAAKDTEYKCFVIKDDLDLNELIRALI